MFWLSLVSTTSNALCLKISKIEEELHMMSLTNEDIKNDLKVASEDDVAFNKKLYYQLTGDIEKTPTKTTDVTKCYDEIKEFLKGKQELERCAKRLQEKQTDIAGMQSELNKAVETLETERDQLKS